MSEPKRDPTEMGDWELLSAVARLEMRRLRRQAPKYVMALGIMLAVPLAFALIFVAWVAIVGGVFAAVAWVIANTGWFGWIVGGVLGTAFAGYVLVVLFSRGPDRDWGEPGGHGGS